jgi:hypothetical protein
VTVRVIEVDRLAHEESGEPGERNALAGGVCEPGRELKPLRQQQGKVVEPAVTVRGTAGALQQNQEVAVAAERRRAALAAPTLKPTTRS